MALLFDGTGHFRYNTGPWLAVGDTSGPASTGFEFTADISLDDDTVYQTVVCLTQNDGSVRYRVQIWPGGAIDFWLRFSTLGGTEWRFRTATGVVTTGPWYNLQVWTSFDSGVRPRIVLDGVTVAATEHVFVTGVTPSLNGAWYLGGQPVDATMSADLGASGTAQGTTFKGRIENAAFGEAGELVGQTSGGAFTGNALLQSLAVNRFSPAFLWSYHAATTNRWGLLWHVPGIEAEAGALDAITGQAPDVLDSAPVWAEGPPVTIEPSTRMLDTFEAPPEPEVCDDHLTDDDIIAFKWAAGDSQIVNRVIAEFDYNATTDTFEKMLIFQHDLSVARYGPRPEVHIQSKGLRTDLGADAYLEDRAREIFLRFGDGPPAVLNVEVFYRKNVWEVGDIICVSSAFIPNLMIGGRGLAEEPFELVDCRPQFADRGRLSCTLLDVEAMTNPPPIIISVIDPTASLEDALTVVGIGGPMARLAA